MRYLNDTDREWDQWGKTDPYFAVFSDDRFRRVTLDDHSLQEFFVSGQRHVDHVMEVISLHLRPGFVPARVLDYGCGVGRLVFPFAQGSGLVTGVDVSPAMIQEAAKNAVQRKLENVRFLLTQDFEAEATGHFDLIHSFIVFQHLRPKRGEGILRNLLRRLEPGGLGAIHITFDSNASIFLNAVRGLRKRSRLVNGILNLVRGNSLSQPGMQLNTYSLNRIFRLLLAEGCGSIYVEFSDHGGLLGTMLYFEKTQPPLL